MKFKNFILPVILVLSISINAQPGTPGWRSSMLNVPYLSRSTPSPDLLINQRFHFDKKMVVKLELSAGQISHLCIWLNTTDGYMGILPITTGGSSPIVDILPELSDFVFSIIGMNGNVYRYYNAEGKRGSIEKWVSSFNTESYKFEYTYPVVSSVLRNKNQPGNYFNGQVTGAKAYMFDGGTAKLFLYGNSYPQNIHVQKIFGNFGVGYLRATEGTYLIFETQNFETSFKIKSIETNFASFTPSDYKLVEDVYFQKRSAEFEKEEEKIARDEAKINSGDCITERTHELNWRKQLIRQQKTNLLLGTTGNLYQDKEAQKAVFAQMDPLITVQSSIYTAKISLCNTRASLSRYPGDASLNRTIACLQTAIVNLEQVEARLHAIDLQYANDISRAYLEKSAYYLRNRQIGCE